MQTDWTPLMKASRKGHVDIVRILIDAKAQVNTQERVCCYYHTLHKIIIGEPTQYQLERFLRMWHCHCCSQIPNILLMGIWF